MPTIDNLDPSSTALLVMDHQNMLVQGFTKDPAAHLEAVARVIGTARDAGLTIIYIRKAFRHGYPEVHDANMIFSGVRAGRRLLEGDEATAIPERIAPAEGDIVVRGHRISAFEGTELSLVLRANRIETLVMFGIATSGVVLSTVRQGADKDFAMFVLGDLCADNDAEVNDFLLQQIIPRQAVVLSSDELIDRLGRS